MDYESGSRRRGLGVATHTEEEAAVRHRVGHYRHQSISLLVNSKDGGRNREPINDVQRDRVGKVDIRSDRTDYELGATGRKAEPGGARDTACSNTRAVPCGKNLEVVY